MSFINNVKVTLNAGITSSATSVQVVKAINPFNDPPTSGKLTLMDSLSSPTKIEIISYTGRTDNTTYWTLTGVTRGQESTTASAFSSGDSAVQTWTAGDASLTINNFPFYKADGTQDNIGLDNGSLPFYTSNGTQDNIGLA